MDTGTFLLWVQLETAEAIEIDVILKTQELRMVLEQIRDLQAESTDFKNLRAESTDFKLHVAQMCCDLWALLYDDPTGWQYLTQPLVHIRVEIDQLRAENAELLEALEQVEWVPVGDLGIRKICPWCKGTINYYGGAHEPACPRQAAIRKAAIRKARGG